MKKIIIALFLAIASTASAAPSFWSFGDILDFITIGGHIASGVGALPAVASAGTRYTDLSVATAPVDYRSNGSSWVLVSGVSTHSYLTGLDFAGSGHTGFASAGAIIAVDGRVDEVSASMTDMIARVASAESDIAGHMADQVDPHGASQTISESLTIGSGTADTFFRRYATGVAEIATWAVIAPSTASPTSPATGTLWNDPAAGIKVWDHHGSWSTLLTDYPAWQDLRVSLLSAKLSGSNEPGLTVVRTNGGGSQGVLTYAFDKASEEELYTSVQLPHDCYKTVVEPHIHWMPSGTGAGTVTWCIEYTLTNYLATQPAATTIATCSQSTNEIDRQHLIADFPAIDISGAKDSAILLFRIYRAAANASDTYDADAFATDFDLRYQVRNKGSEDEYGDND